MLAALDAADSVQSYEQALRSEDHNHKRNWSNRFADGCAQIVADAVRAHPAFGKFEVRPNPDGSGKEALTFVAAKQTKRVDVIAATLATGLQLGISLKGLNFRDESSSYDHNLTGRTYELQDEVGVIHEYQPSSFVAALYFLPIQATHDKVKALTSFARTVAHLRARTGRVDPFLPSQLRRCDAAAVALYVPGVPGDLFSRGVVRYFDVAQDPPRRGRPRVETTLALGDWVDQLASAHANSEADIDWAEPESDPPTS